MPVVQIKTELKCRLCQHPRRVEIDALLERRSRGESDSDGKRINSEYVLARLAEWGLRDASISSLTRHFGKHCEVVDDEEASKREEELDEIQQEMLAAFDSSDGTIDGDLEVIRRVGMKRIRRLILEGKDPGITNDHVLKAVAEQTKRSNNEAARELLGALTGGLAKALSQPRQPKQLPPAEVIDAELVEEAEVEANG